MNQAIRPQNVRWGPSDRMAAGVRVWSDEDQSDEAFIAFSDLKGELEAKLLPQLLQNGAGYRFELRDYFGKPNWLLLLVGPDGERYCDVWMGGNPEFGGAFDGLVRVGDAQSDMPVWQTYQRYSDGTYRRRTSRVSSVDVPLRAGGKGSSRPSV